jgi:hypothetical protein
VRPRRPRRAFDEAPWAAPVLIFYLFLQRHFIRGELAGAIKE